MFHGISSAILQRMDELVQIDTRDRLDGTGLLERLRQIPPDTGKFVAMMAACAPEGKMIEIGTSAGYSAMWISLACEMLGRTLTTFEVLPEKVKMARETFRLAELEDIVQLVEGDAREHLTDIDEIAFCFLDAEKEIYADCYELVVPKLVKGGLLVADNAINHRASLQPMLDRALSDVRVDAQILTVGKGELLCRKI